MKEFRKNEQENFICEECGKTFNNRQAIGTHIGWKHVSKNYYDKWLKDINDDVCLNCGKPTQFKNLRYLNTCSKECKNIYCHKQTQLGMLKSHGVQCSFNMKNIKEKALKNIKISNLKNFGVEYPFQLNKIQDKIKENNLKKYGVKNQFQRQEIKDKNKQTSLKNNGVENPMQNKKIFEKQQKTALKLKQFKDTDIKYRASYELDFLEKFHNKHPDIINGPSIKYIFNESKKIYFPDFYIPSLNLIVEIKNSYLAKRDKDKIEAKEKATIANGFIYLVIIDKNYIEFNKMFN